LRGLVHQKVIFGITGQPLKLREDTTDCACFVPGMLVALRSCSTA
jgi:dihydrodipicolinate reductase